MKQDVQKFWPLDDNPECEIYENLAWDLPGFRGTKAKASGSAGRKRRNQVKLTSL
jgi:hypothetical protein